MSYAYGKDEIVIATGLDKPPYSVQNGQSGFEIELVRLIFQQMDKQAEFIPSSLPRTMKQFDLSKVEAILTTNQDSFSDSTHLSDPYIRYRNAAISLSKKSIRLNKVIGLANYAVVSFKNAKLLLGEDYTAMVGTNQMYFEITDQSKQLDMLSSEKCDLLIMDISIFNYFNQSQQLSVDRHFIFGDTLYRVAFRDKQLIPEFNAALNKILASSDYQTLIKQWHIDPTMALTAKPL